MDSWAGDNKLENMMVESAEVYRSEGFAEIWKFPTPTKPVNLRGKVIWVCEAKPPFDFMGWRCDGTSVCAEAKETSSDKLSIDEKNKSGLHLRQLKFLAKAQRHGACSLIVWSNPSGIYTCSRPASILDRYITGERGSKTVKIDELWDEVPIEVMGGRPIYHWMKPYQIRYC